MANQKNTIRQHEILRVPKGWENQDRALVIQLNRVLDDIYAQFNSKTFTAAAASGQTEYDLTGRKDGNVCVLNVRVQTTGSSGWLTVATLARDCRPSTVTYGIIADESDSSAASRMRVTADGEVQIYGTTSGHTYCGSIVFIR